MKAAFYTNKYYRDDGIEYVYSRLKAEFLRFGIDLLSSQKNEFVTYPSSPSPHIAFAVFWDKDVRLCRQLERNGIRCFNGSDALEKSDDKEKTFAALYGSAVCLPKTIAAPLKYDVCTAIDPIFLQEVIKTLGFPLVCKENVGSQGRQVWLIKDKTQLYAAEQRLLHVPHLYQQFVSGKSGSDVRVFTIGGKAVAAVERTNTTDFHSNVCLGGTMTQVPLSEDLRVMAETVAAALGLDFGSADFILSPNGAVFIEANSNAYLKTAESLGINLVCKIASYIAEEMQIAETKLDTDTSKY